MPAAQAATSEYRVSGYLDEAFRANGEVRPAYGELFEGVSRSGLNEVQGKVQTDLAGAGVSFGPEGMRSAFVVELSTTASGLAALLASEFRFV